MSARELRSRYVYFLLFVVTIDQTTADVFCKKISDSNCECRRTNGKTFSLEPVDGGKAGPRFKDMEQKKGTETFTFHWNPCTPFSESDGKCKDVLLCQHNGGLAYPIAKTVDSFAENNDGSITLTYNGIQDEKQITRRAIFKMVCDAKQNPGKFSPFVEKDGTGGLLDYTATFSSKCVCDEGCADNPTGESNGLSTGSILLIVFFLLILVYLVAGLLYNKNRKGAESFPEMIPNHSFWADFPFLVKDGCVFTFQGIAGCCRRLYRNIKGESYAEI